MEKETITISSAGLQNVVINKYYGDDFVFVFGEQKIELNNFFAEFISPVVSKLHQTDPTINTINFGEVYSGKDHEFTEFAKSVFTSETISLFQQISSGFSIEIDEEQAMKMRFLAIILGNEELNSEIDYFFPFNCTENNVNTYLKYIQSSYNFSLFWPDFDFTHILSSVAKNFWSIDEGEFLRLPRSIQYKIISHPQLQIISEDSLFDIVYQIIEMGNETDEYEDILFLEQIEFTSLSKPKLCSFISSLNINQVTSPLWKKLLECFSEKINDSKIDDAPSLMNQGRYAKIIYVGGHNGEMQLGVTSNNKSEDGYNIVCPPLKLFTDYSSLLSFSIYMHHSVIVYKNGKMAAVGDNSDSKICSSLPKEIISEFTEFRIVNYILNPISAVCYYTGTIYMLSTTRNEILLALCDSEINEGKVVFLNIDDQRPVALFGGSYHSAAVTNEGSVIFINPCFIRDYPDSRLTANSLPNGEKAISVAFNYNSIAVLSSKGRVFMSSIDDERNNLDFSLVEELSGKEIVYLSGIYKHYLAVSKEGLVFCYGSNDRGRLGLKKEITDVSSFTEISSLREYEITEAYAGGYHSLFKTKDGKILACGCNDCGQLLLGNSPSQNYVFTPIETMISSDAIFAIVGLYVSVVFVGSWLPPNIPNRIIK